MCYAMLFAAVAGAQVREIDSLRALLQLPDALSLADTVAVTVLNRLAALYRLRSADSALYYAEQAASIAERVGYPKGKLYALLTRLSIYGGYNTSVSNLAHIKSVADSAFLLARTMDEQTKADALLEVGRAYSSRLDKEKGIQLLLEALESYERLGDKTGMGKAWYYIALVHYTNGQYQDALDANQNAVRWMQETGNRRSTAIILNNLALCYDELRQADTAVAIWKNALSLAEAVDEVQTIWSVTANLARVCVRKKQYAEAEQYIARSLEVSKSYPARYASSLMHKARIHLAKGEVHSAKQSAEESLRIYRQTQGYALPECLNLLAEIYAAQGNFKEAYHFQKQYAELQDSIQTARKAEIVAELQSKYDVAKKNQEIELLQRDRERDALLRNALVGGIILTASLALVIANRFRLKQKAEAEIQQKNLALQAALEEAERQANEAKRQRAEAEAQRKLAEEASAMKSELLSIASHDLQNPLQSIIGFACLIKERCEDNPVLLRSVSAIEHAAQRMLRLITDLLVTAALDTGQFTLKREIVELDELVQTVVEMFQVQAQQKRQTLHCTATSGAKVYVDAERMREVLDNLISNAIKYSQPNTHIWVSVALTANEEPVGNEVASQASAQCRERQHTVRIMVRDEGEGLSEDDMKRLFGKFQRLSARPTGGESSTGLGLSIVKQIVELHGGRVWAESEGKGKGTTFIVELPVADRTGC